VGDALGGTGTDDVKQERKAEVLDKVQTLKQGKKNVERSGGGNNTLGLKKT